MRRAVFALLALLLLYSHPALAQNPLDALRLGDLDATRSRPLFAPTRRPAIRVDGEAPAPPPTVEEKPVAAETSPFELLGSAIGRESAFALLRNKASGKVVRIRRGEAEDGWRIDSISLRAITLQKDGITQELVLSAPAPGGLGPQVTGDQDNALTTAPPSLADSKRAGEPTPK